MWLWRREGDEVWMVEEARTGLGGEIAGRRRASLRRGGEELVGGEGLVDVYFSRDGKKAVKRGV
jgi:hypothetical protein